MSDGEPFRVVVVDDEPLGWQRVVQLLEDHDDVEVVGVAEDGDAAVEAIRDLDPHLVFLDVRMPGRTGLDVVREVGADAMPPTVFVTAYDRYALQAFRLAAVDYLVKPYSDERFEEALRRARRQVELEDLGALRSQLRRLLESSAVGASSREQESRYLKRIAVQKRGRMRVVPVEEIDHIRADGAYAEVHAGDEQHLIRTALRTLEEQLDPEEFCRIHRSEIVRLDRVELLIRGEGGRYEVELTTGDRLPVGRSRREELERRLGRL